jgi:hypothetical protein
MRWNAELEKLGLLRVFRAKLTPILNALNVYTLITKRRDTNVTLKNKYLKTTTPAGAGFQFRRMWEQLHAERRAHDAKVSAHMRGVYDGTGAWWLKAAYDRTRRALEASVGTYRPRFDNGLAGMNGQVCGLEPPTPEQLAEGERMVKAMEERAERERIAKEAKKQADREAAEAFNRSLQPSAEALAAAEARIARMLAMARVGRA